MTETKAPRFQIHTLGCKVNQYDSENLRTQLLRQGYVSAHNEQVEELDLIVVNTCSVTSESDRKGRQMIRKLIRKHPQAKMVVTGCYATRKPDDLYQIDGIHEILPIENQDEWVNRIANEMGWGCEDQDALWQNNQGIETFQEHTRAFVKIQDGCDLKCTFCSIPISRGVGRSRPVEDVVNESRHLVELGYPEVVLCGICIGHYGHGLDYGLPSLLRELVKIDGLKRVRISSLEPQDVSDELYDVMAEHSDTICPHLHLPIQAGANRILRRMKRPYTREFFFERVETARKRLTEFEISTDLMVGFPGETDEEFEQSLEAVRIARFNKVHSFRFSAREETPAMKLKDHLLPQVVEERRKRLDEVANDVANQVKESYIGKTLPVLAETPEEHHNIGFTPNYIKAEFSSPQPVQKGKAVQVRFTGLAKGRLQGTAVES